MSSIRIFLVLIVFLTAHEFVTSQEPQVPELRILNWSEYIDLDPRPENVPQETWDQLPLIERSETLREFAREFKCRIHYEEFDAPDQAQLRLSGSRRPYDLVVLSSYQIVEYRAADLLQPLNQALLSNMQNLLPEMRSAGFDDGNKWSIPYLVGSAGILYRHDLVKDLKSWKQVILEPPVELKGKIAILEDSSVLVSAALKALSLSANSTDPKALRQAQRALVTLRQNGFLAELSSDVEFVNQGLLDGRFAAAIVYSGDGSRFANEHPERLKFVLPDEGSVWFIDNMVIPKQSREPALAHAFINYVLRPRVHARLAAALRYQCPNLPAREFLPPELLADRNVYPDAAMMKLMETYNNLDPARERVLQVLRK